MTIEDAPNRHFDRTFCARLTEPAGRQPCGGSFAAPPLKCARETVPREDAGGAMRVVLVCGPWGSGTSAVAGLLDRLGAVGFGPYFHTNDPRTPNAYELLPFRQLVLRFAAEQTASLQESSEDEIMAALLAFRERIEKQELGRYDPAGGPPIFLKHPLAVLLLPQLARVFETKLVSVMRSVEEIEATRLRRRWPAHFGQQGAEIVYRHLESVAQAPPCAQMRVKYDELLRSPAYVARRLVQFAGLAAQRNDIERAAEFVTRRG
jgi:hypothetical protein